MVDCSGLWQDDFAACGGLCVLEANDSISLTGSSVSLDADCSSAKLGKILCCLQTTN